MSDKKQKRRVGSRVEMILSCVIAFAVTLIVGRMLIPALRRLKRGRVSGRMALPGI